MEGKMNGICSGERVFRHTLHVSFSTLILSLLIVASQAQFVFAQDSKKANSGFQGPSSVEAELAEDAEIRKQSPQNSSTPLTSQLFAPWFAFKERVKERTGLQAGFDYTAFAQHVSSSPGEDNATGGIFRAFGTWTLFNQGGTSGALVYKFENRHRLGTDVSPIALGFVAGSAVPTGVPFSDYGWGVTNLYWRQSFRSGRFNFIAGKIDATDYLDVYALINPWTSFQNLAFSTNPTIAAPDQGLGFATGAALTENVYVVAGINDANGSPTKAGFDTFFDRGEYFKSVEIGLTSSFERRYLDNVHLTYWHADQRTQQNVPESWGLAFSAATFINDKWLPFLRAGYSEGGAALYKRTVAGGLGYRFENTDVFGLGVGWGQPFGADTRDQVTTEMFYRWQVSDVFAVTPNLQVLFNPSNNQEKDTLTFIGLRGRAAF
jgi:porin